MGGAGKVGYLEALDQMVRQLVRRLSDVEQEDAARFVVCVTGDHSTPVVFGDHSHEPIPFVMSHVRCGCTAESTSYLTCATLETLSGGPYVVSQAAVAVAIRLHALHITAVVAIRLQAPYCTVLSCFEFVMALVMLNVTCIGFFASGSQPPRAQCHVRSDAPLVMPRSLKASWNGNTVRSLRGELQRTANDWIPAPSMCFCGSYLI